MSTDHGPHSEYGSGVTPTDPAMRDIAAALTGACRKLARLGVDLAREGREIERLHARARGETCHS